jgi:RNA polymerase sigma-70 factor (ECF subfamily)
MNHQSADMTTNPSLLLRLRDVRDRQAWALFVEVYGPLIFSYCRRKKLQDSDSADVSQEVLTRLSKALTSFEYQPESGRFRDWLGQVTHRELLQFWKRQGRTNAMHATDGHDAIQSAEDTKNWDEHFHSELLRLAFARIRTEFEHDTWLIFEQLWFEDKQPAEVASFFEINLGSVYVAKSRVLKKLRAEVLMLSDDLPLME